LSESLLHAVAAQTNEQSCCCVALLSSIACLGVCAQGVLEKFSQIQPSLMFSVNAVIYNGKLHSHLDKVKQVAEGEFMS